jgi:hypothetical protein
MITDPHELDFADGMKSNEFAWEKTSRQILEPLGFETEKEWLDYARAVWKWKTEAQARDIERQASRILTEANPQLIEALKQKLLTDKHSKAA